VRRRAFILAWLAAAAARGQQPIGASQAVVFPKIVRGRALQFPRDHGAHFDYRTEWWYVTGALDAPQANIGFQLTFFRVRTGSAEALSSPLAPTQILFAHAAVTLPGDGLYHAERAARHRLGGLTSPSDCDVYIGAWQLQRGANDTFILKAQDSQFVLDLSLTPTQPLILQGDAGYSRKGARAEQASYYVSWPHLRVEGALTLKGKSTPARGTAWFDHEWSSEVLSDADVGWDWLGVNLDNGGALMLFRIRNAAGETAFAHASMRDANGRTQTWSGDEVRFQVKRNWRSPRGTSYPVELKVRFGEFQIVTRPTIDDQELVARRPVPVRYWEGLVKVEGALTGRGYLELTGYAEKLRL
jgi:predicted secreted hydrolase